MEQITVIIPNYNGMKFLRGCLDSLLASVEKARLGVRILVIDNGSNDGSLELLKEYHNIDTIALLDNTGFCHAVNLGIENSKTEYVILLNNDTEVMPNFVLELYNAIKERPKCFSVSSKMLMWDRHDLLDDAGDLYTILGWALARGKGKAADKFDIGCNVFSACGGASIYRREVFHEIGLFDEAHFAYLEDLDMGYRAKLYGYYNAYEPKAEVIHFGSASTGSRYNDKKTELAASNSVYVPYKNMPFLQLLINLPFLMLGYLIKTFFFAKKHMGMKYLKGLGSGIRKCISPAGRAAKVPVTLRRIPIYVKIELELIGNVFRILNKGK